MQTQAFSVEQKEFGGLVPAQHGRPLAAAVGDICLTQLPSKPRGSGGAVSPVTTALPSLHAQLPASKQAAARPRLKPSSEMPLRLSKVMFG